MDRARVLTEIRRRGQELVNLCGRLVRIPTENPPGDTTALVAFLEGSPGDRGIATARHEQVRRRAADLLGRGVEMEATNRCACYVTLPDEPLVQARVRSPGAALGTAASPVIRPGDTDGRLFRRHGVPTAVYGPRMANMGGPDESIDVEEVPAVVPVHAGAIVDDLGDGS